MVARRTSSSTSFFFFRLVLFCGFFCTVSMGANQAVMKIVDFTSWKYGAEIASFGSYLDSNIVYPANLMTPHDDPQLCTFPESIFDFVNISSSVVDIIAPVALLVSHGGCTTLEKLRVAMEMQQKVPRILKYIVFYNNNPDDPEAILGLQTPVDLLPAEESDLELLGILSVSTNSGSAILSRIHHLSLVTGLSPQLLTPWNRRWRLLTEFSQDTDLLPRNSGNEAYGTVGSGGFYWFRFVLFTLLIVSPCFRAGYLWWAGGGRLHLRYNEQGRLVGLQYVPPMSVWFVATGAHGHGPVITDRLTEEQVLALPEISYKPPRVVGREDDGVDRGEPPAPPIQTQQQEESNQELDEAEIVISSGSADAAEDPKKKEDTDSQTMSLSTSSDRDEEQPAAETVPNSGCYETNCITCSICIDDFELGERIRILPRCGHAYHLDCIMPWLTERQGCCPLCKTSVLEEDESPPSGATAMREGRQDGLLARVSGLTSGRRGTRRQSDQAAPLSTSRSSIPAAAPSVSVPSPPSLTEVSNRDVLPSGPPRTNDSSVSEEDCSGVSHADTTAVPDLDNLIMEASGEEDLLEVKVAETDVDEDDSGVQVEAPTDLSVKLSFSAKKRSIGTESQQTSETTDSIHSSCDTTTESNGKIPDFLPKESLPPPGVSSETFATTNTAEAFSDFNGSATQDFDGARPQSGDSVVSL
jgi:hypothetical protein